MSRVSCDRVCSPLLRCCFALVMSAIQLGWAECCEGLGDSGRERALSSQLALVGLHRLEGLSGGEQRPAGVASEATERDLE